MSHSQTPQQQPQPYSRDLRLPYPNPNTQYTSSPAFDPNAPPLPPPKPSSHETSRITTPQTGPPLPPPPTQTPQSYTSQQPQSSQSHQPQPPSLEDGWLPDILKDKSKADLSEVLSSPELVSALATAPSTTHPSLPASLVPIQNLLAQNLSLASTLLTLSTSLSHLRTQTESSLLHLHALERQWRQKQSALDNALEPFSHRALHQRLVLSIGEQEAVCEALEESFLEGEGRAGEREVTEFLKRYREGRKVLGLRRERKERWDEGRVGGWR